MPGIYETLRNAKAGEAAMREADARKMGMEIADRELANAEAQEQARIMRATRDAQAQQQAYDMGARDGLGLGSQTVQSIQQLGQTREQSMQEEAMAIIQELETAKAEGATNEQISAMASQIPPELIGTVKAVRQQMLQQQPQGMPHGSPQGIQMVTPAAQENAITAYAKQLLREQ